MKGTLSSTNTGIKEEGKKKSSERKRSSEEKDSTVAAGHIGTTKKMMLLSRGKSARKRHVRRKYILSVQVDHTSLAKRFYLVDIEEIS